jgi:tetraacyldisaccharide 4'-kinase
MLKLKLYLDKILTMLWYHNSRLTWILVPFSWIYRVIIAIRRRFTRVVASQVPLIVVGNLTVGGTGKTPLVIAIAKAMQQKDFNVGIVSRGYGATIRDFPRLISLHDNASDVGDEPLLMAIKTGCPVIISPNRILGVEQLVNDYHCDLIISDDGLQHHRMGRTVEIVVIDGVRGFGNRYCWPAGPLREPVSRLKSVDFKVVNGGQWPDAYSMSLVPSDFVNLKTKLSIKAEDCPKPIAAVAGIGHPERFFSTLLDLKLTFTPYCFPDHYAYQPHDLSFSEETIVTEKDGVKCQGFATSNHYVLPVDAVLPASFWDALYLRLLR